MMPHPPRTMPIGRFAPSPTGRLHLGSLTTALASYCQIKSIGGQWLLRIEDTDTTRCHSRYSQQILADLEALGLHCDGISYQSDRTDIYHHHLNKLSALIYPCFCSRKQLAGFEIYPQFCTPTPPNPPLSQGKLRLMLPAYDFVFLDNLQGICHQNPQKTLGDMIVRRQDGVINYILACAIDDGLQNISHVVRGLDILPMTAAQIFIQKTLNLPSPDYWYHLPLVLSKNGQKLSKQNLATPINTTRPSWLLFEVLTLLGQSVPSSLKNAKTCEILAWAVQHWQDHSLKKQAFAID